MRRFLIAAALALISAMPASAAQQAPGAKMHITINGQTFAATLADTKAAAAFGALLPLTLELQDYNRNEKVGALPHALPAADEAVGRIEAGDILLWQGSNLVVFYESFNTPYRYTRIGKINNAANLKSAVGAGSVLVRFARYN